MSAYYRRILDHALGMLMRVQFTTQGRDVVDYAVVLLRDTEKGLETIRVYDSAHGHNEMHRYPAARASSEERPSTAVLLEKAGGLHHHRVGWAEAFGEQLERRSTDPGPRGLGVDSACVMKLRL
jgi:hypothetical protein